MKSPDGKPKVGLILSGGGARAAYQVGVLKAVAEMLPRGCANPFPIVCGTSAGAINSATLAVYARRFHEGVRRLIAVWGNFHTHHVIRVDPLAILSSAFRWYGALLFGGLGKFNPAFLLDRAPLKELLDVYLPPEKIQASIDSGALQALSVTASSYTDRQSIVFFQGVDGLAPWQRAQRSGIASPITTAHLMASSAIPFLFSAVKVGHEYYGDGSMRQIAPLSPAVHLGADRVLVVGSRQEHVVRTPHPEIVIEYPTLAQIAGHTLNSLFSDSLEADIERLERINKTVRLLPGTVLEENGLHLREVNSLVISPSEDLGKIAGRHKFALPRALRLVLKGIGAFDREGGDLVSYLLFEKAYCQELIALGYADAMKRREELTDFLGLDVPVKQQAVSA